MIRPNAEGVHGQKRLGTPALNNNDEDLIAIV